MTMQTGRTHIDPMETNWYLKHRKTWGNPKRIAIILLSHWLFWFTIIESLAVYVVLYETDDYTLPRICQVISALIPTLFDIYLYLKFPTFEDHLSISDEVKHTLRLEIMMVCFYTVVGVLLRATFYSIKYFLVSMIMPIILFMFTFFSLFYPLNKCNLPTMPWNAIKFKRTGTQSLGINQNMITELAGTSSHETEANNPDVCIHAIMQNKHGFEGFVCLSVVCCVTCVRVDMHCVT